MLLTVNCETLGIFAKLELLAILKFFRLLSPPLSLQIFGTPKDHRKSKPYHDHVFVFSIVDNHIWFRNYQVGDNQLFSEIVLLAHKSGC